MSKYYKAEDIQGLITACEWRITLAKERNGEGFVDYSKQVLDVNELTERLDDLPTIEVSEENELKFYYVESIDDYWIGQRLDNFYYAEWCGNYFVWTHSRYLPWGEHVVNKDTLWKEHTYPSEPREMPFTEWIVGFMKKYGSEVSEDCISRADAIKAYNEAIDELVKAEMEEFNLGDFTECSFNTTQLKLIARKIENAPSVTTEQSSMVGEWIVADDESILFTVYKCSRCGKVHAHSPHNYCPNCGAKMKGADDE